VQLQFLHPHAFAGADSTALKEAMLKKENPKMKAKYFISPPRF
jgi:hypothetical protein